MLEKETFRQPSLPGFVDELSENKSLFEHLPFSDFRRWVPEDGIIEKAFHNLPLSRLGYIKALSFLSYIGPDPENIYFLEYRHDRLDHSLVVALITGEILRQNGFPESTINLGTLAGLLHDIATPAHGDATKQVDPESLNEEKFWWQVIDKKGWKFIKQYGGDKKTLDKIIANGGALGKTLDIADRITYTMKDLFAVVGHTNPKQFVDLEGSYLSSLCNILSLNPNLGNIYKEVGVDAKKEEVFFNNPERLALFLLLRAHLFKALYLNPISQGRDMVVAKLIYPLYARKDKSKLTPEKLRNITDSELIAELAEAYSASVPRKDMFYHTLVNWYPQYEKVEDRDKAKMRVFELSKRKNIAVIGAKECKGFDPATTYKVVDQKGKIVSFRECYPEKALQIERIAESTKGIFVFYTDLAKDFPINPLLKALLKSQRGKLL